MARLLIGQRFPRNVWPILLGKVSRLIRSALKSSLLTECKGIVIVQVYKASYLHCDIAIKKLNRINDAKSEEAFRRECAILKGCRNPYIVNFMGVCKDEVSSS